MAKYVIFTCITGGFDSLLQPLVTDPDFDFVCFLPEEEVRSERIGEWHIRPLRAMPLSNRLLAKYVKMHERFLLSEYEYSLWIDGNIRVATAEVFGIFREKVARGILFSGINHPLRDDVYEEALKVYSNGLDSYGKVMDTVSFLSRERYPRHSGLYETNVVFRKHSDPAVASFDELWWEMVNRYSSRDQLSHGYCLRKAGLRDDHFVPEDYSARDYPAFGYVFHGKAVKRSWFGRKWHGLVTWWPSRRLVSAVRKIK